MASRISELGRKGKACGEKGKRALVCKAFSFLGCLNELDQGCDFVLGRLIESAFPLSLRKLLPKIGLHREIRMPAYDSPRAGEVPCLYSTVGKGNLPSQSGAPDLQVVVHGILL